MPDLSNVSDTVVATIQSFGMLKFGLLVIANIILYRLHPIFGFLGTLFLFAILMHWI